MLPSSPSADYISDATLRLCFGRAVFCCPFPGEQGSTTAHLRRLPRKGRAGGAFKSLLKHRVQGAALPAMLPSSPSADYISVCSFTALLRQSRFFVAPFPENWGARLRISGGCPARGEPEALIDLCSSIACRAQPCQRCSPVLQALIIFQMQLYGSASAESFFVAPFPENWGARLRISGGCPARGEPEALLNPCSSIAC